MRRQAIRDDVGVLAARRAARDIARTLGFGATVAEEICIVASELGSNILKYGRRGEIHIQVVDDPEHGKGVRLIARDEGPPFVDLAMALKDGHDDQGPLDPDEFPRRRGIGGGLGAIQRFTDELVCEPEPGGKRIVVTRFLRAPRGRKSR